MKQSVGAAPSHLVMMVNEIADADTFFGLLLDPLNKTVVSGHVLQVSVVQATQVTEEGRSLRLWNQSEIDRMTSIVKEHEGRVRNAFIDPYEGQSDGWTTVTTIIPRSDSIFRKVLKTNCENSSLFSNLQGLKRVHRLFLLNMFCVV